MLVTLPKRRVPCGIAARDADPRILAELLQPSETRFFSASNLRILAVTSSPTDEHFRRVLHAAPGEVGDVQQAVDAAQVHERAVVGDVLDDALHDRAFLERLEQLLALDTGGLFHHGAARDDDVVALAVELDDLELELLAFEVRGVLHGRRSTSEPGGRRGCRSP
jgi:hypothetical protein